MPELLSFVALPLACLAFACGLGAAAHERVRGRPAPGVVRVGAVAWWALVALSARLASLSASDWVHLLWSVKFPLLALFAAAGVVLLSPRGDAAAEARRPLGVAAVLLALGVLPIALLALGGDPDPPARATGRPWVGLAETAWYGFGGPRPECMRPESPDQLARGLGHPPREVTVPLGTTGVAALLVALLAACAFLARIAPRGPGRTALLVAAPPLALAVASFADTGWLWREQALWTNEPSLVRSYGPWLLAGAVGLFALAAAAALGGPRPRHERLIDPATESRRSRARARSPEGPVPGC